VEIPWYSTVIEPGCLEISVRDSIVDNRWGLGQFAECSCGEGAEMFCRSKRQSKSSLNDVVLQGWSPPELDDIAVLDSA
jgi:hypothetical protein